MVFWHLFLSLKSIAGRISNECTCARTQIHHTNRFKGRFGQGNHFRTVPRTNYYYIICNFWKAFCKKETRKISFNALYISNSWITLDIVNEWTSFHCWLPNSRMMNTMLCNNIRIYLWNHTIYRHNPTKKA